MTHLDNCPLTLHMTIKRYVQTLENHFIFCALDPAFTGSAVMEPWN